MATSTGESGTARSTFFKDLVARALHGVALVTSDAHARLVDKLLDSVQGLPEVHAHLDAAREEVLAFNVSAGQRRHQL